MESIENKCSNNNNNNTFSVLVHTSILDIVVICIDACIQYVGILQQLINSSFHFRANSSRMGIHPE
jgi:hypothetical protein